MFKDWRWIACDYLLGKKPRVVARNDGRAWARGEQIIDFIFRVARGDWVEMGSMLRQGRDG